MDPELEASFRVFIENGNELFREMRERERLALIAYSREVDRLANEATRRAEKLLYDAGFTIQASGTFYLEHNGEVIVNEDDIDLDTDTAKPHVCAKCGALLMDSSHRFCIDYNACHARATEKQE